MKKYFKIFLILFQILSSTTWCFGQYSLPKAVFKSGMVPTRDGVIDIPYENMHGYEAVWSKAFGRDVAEYMNNSYSSTEQWPSAINTLEKINKKSTLDILPQYTMYAVKTFYSYKQILYLPEAENRNMPSGFKLKKDIFLITNVQNVRIDSTQCKLVNLPHVVRQASYGDPTNLSNVLFSFDDDSISFDDDSIPSQPLYTNSLGEKYFPPKYDLKGYYCYNILGQDGHKRFIGDLYVGTNYKKALEALDIIQQSYYWRFPECGIWSPRTILKSENGVNGYNYENTDFSPKYNVQASLKIIDDSQQEPYITNQKGYSIRFEAHRYPNPIETFWLQLAKDNKLEGVENVQKYTHFRVIGDKFKLDKAKEFCWKIITVDSFRHISIRFEPYTELHGVTSPLSKNVWVTSGQIDLGSGNYNFYTTPSDNNDNLKNGRSLLFYGFRDSEKSRILAEREDSISREEEIAAQKSRYSSQEEFDRKFAWAEDTTRLLLKGEGYSAFEKHTFDGSGKFQIPVLDGRIMTLTAISFNENVRLKVNSTDLTDNQSSSGYQTNGIFRKVLEIKVFKDGMLSGEIQFEGTGGDKSHKTVLLLARQDGESIPSQSDESGNAIRKSNSGYYKGSITDSAGNKYVGSLRFGEPFGEGTMTYSNGDVYIGSYEWSRRTGYGVYKSANGRVYKGEWTNNLRNGQGTYYNANGEVLYSGDWKDDNPI